MKAIKLAKIGLDHVAVPISKYTGLFQSSPKVCQLYITEVCNLRCKMCDIWRRADPSKELNEKELDNLLHQLKKLNFKLLGISGGEPLLKKGIYEFIKKAKDMGFVVAMNSNATMIRNEEIARKIIESGLDTYTVSIDGFKKTHDEIRGVPGTYERAINGMKLLLKEREKLNKKIRIGTSTVIMKKNLHELKYLTLMLMDLKVDAIAFQPFTIGLMNDDRLKKEHMINSKEDIIKLNEVLDWMKYLKKKTGIIGNSYKFLDFIPTYFQGKKLPSCFAGYFNLDLDSKGNVYPCIAMKSVGNIRKNTIMEIWNNDKFKSFRKNISPTCQKCFIGCYGEPSLLYNPRYMISSLKNMATKFKYIE